MCPYRLTMCVWEITLACCFSCKYCGSAAGKARANELTTKECLSVADQLAEMGVTRISLIGGEVFMRPDWKQIVKRLSSQGLHVNVITNGFLFRESHLKDLVESGAESISVSIDGTEEIHDKYRQKGSFQRAIQAVDTLRGIGFPVSVITTLNSENVQVLDDLWEILKTKGLYAWQLQACSPMGNAATGGIDYRFDFRIPIAFVKKHEKDSLLVGIADNIGYFTPEEGSLRGNRSGKAVFIGCGAGLWGIGISSNGDVRGCESMYDDYFREGNVRERSIREIWEDENAFSYNRKFRPEMLTGACAKCEEGYRCAGGCRSYNYFVHKKLYESPRCARKEQ